MQNLLCWTLKPRTMMVDLDFSVPKNLETLTVECFTAGDVLFLFISYPLTFLYLSLETLPNFLLYLNLLNLFTEVFCLIAAY